VLGEEGRMPRMATARGDGPIAAAFTAVGALVETEIELEDLTIRAATPGRDAVGEVALRARLADRSFSGLGASTDVVDAAVRALLHALNKAAQAAEPVAAAALVPSETEQV